jgi:hypothetical protein
MSVSHSAAPVPWNSLPLYYFLVIVIVMCAGIKYNEAKEEAARQEAKQKKLLVIEEAKKAAAMKGTQNILFVCIICDDQYKIFTIYPCF